MPVVAKVSEPTHVVLKQLAESTGKSMQFILAEAVELYRREKFFENLSRQVLVSQSDSKVWAEELEERALLESTLSDGLD